MALMRRRDFGGLMGARGGAWAAALAAGLFWAGGAFAAESCEELFRFEPFARLGVADLAALEDAPAEEIAGTDRFVLVEEYAGHGPSQGGWTRLAVIVASTSLTASPNVGGVLSTRAPESFASPARMIVHGAQTLKLVFRPTSPGAVAACPKGFEFSVDAKGVVSAAGSVIGHVE